MSSSTEVAAQVNRGGQRDLMAAPSTPLVLEALVLDDSSGYAIAQRVRERSQDSLPWTDGMLYPLLHRLERQGYIEGLWGSAARGRRRKRYRITPRGRARIAAQ